MLFRGLELIHFCDQPLLHVVEGSQVVEVELPEVLNGGVVRMLRIVDSDLRQHVGQVGVLRQDLICRQLRQIVGREGQVIGLEQQTATQVVGVEPLKEVSHCRQAVHALAAPRLQQGIADGQCVVRGEPWLMRYGENGGDRDEEVVQRSSRGHGCGLSA